MTSSTPAYAPLALKWLPPIADFSAALTRLRQDGIPGDELFAALQTLASHQLDFMQTRRLDRALAELTDKLPARAPRLRFALLGNSTLDHLPPGIHAGGLRRGLLIETYVGPYGQWRQQILDAGSALHGYRPDAVLLSLDCNALLPEPPMTATAAEVDAAVDDAVAELVELWRKLRDDAAAIVIQQTIRNNEPPLFGHLDRLVPAAPAAVAARLNARLIQAAAEEHVLVLDLDDTASAKGIDLIRDPMLWHHAKQNISPAAVPWAGDQIARILAAMRGLSKKVLVLDLDNTLWGGVIGDDGVDGIVLGQGSGTGEAYLAFQRYLKQLRSRGVLLAVSSKNDQAIAESAFTDHPEIVLKLDDFAAFEANWNDKPSALRRIAHDLDLGLDSLVFVDDNPVERALVRRELPMVAVPELPEAPELYARCIAEAGYFEAVSFTGDDVKRNDQYVANRQRRQLQSSAGSIDGFLRDLQMTLTVTPFQAADLARVTQLINKTNQFNLTTRRYTEAEVRAMMEDPSIRTYAGRLTDRFGDNGLTSIVIGRLTPKENELRFDLDSWLMSCRILGRRVEHVMLTLLAQDALAAGASALIGHYRPTPKNGLVKRHYPDLGFMPLDEKADGEETTWMLPLATAQLPPADHLTVVYRR
ncbi:MAG TPA: HAD-IIIC family phosphatase [Ferrovibrio sp.]|uniref:HAD-IIIC family phosphatase n=1 Tax=Ferrovibrio sp. TaxID=1917215 RepID=UPI002ED2A020